MGNLGGFWGKLFRVERDRNGKFTYFLEGDGFINSDKYLDKSFDNPVLMTIVLMRAKIFSQMRITHINEATGEPVKNSPVLKLLKTPNFFQSQKDFLFQLMWFQSTAGTDLVYQKKAFASNDLPQAVYNLIPTEIDVKKTNKIKKFIATKAEIKEYQDQKIVYKLDGQEIDLMLSEIIPFYDCANGLYPNAFAQSPSRVKGIMRTLENIEENLKSKNMNLKMSQKYLATNTSMQNGVKPQLTTDDRTTIEKILYAKSMQITNADVDVKHLVSDFKKLFLDEMFSNDALTCLLAFEMNRDMLNYFSNGASTYENQQSGMLSYLQNSIMVDAESTMDSFSQQWGLFEKGEKLVASYDHLPVMQSVMAEKIDTFTKYQSMLKAAIDAGTISEADAKIMSKTMKTKLGL